MRLLMALSVVVLTVLLNWQNEDIAPIQEISQQTRSAIIHPQKKHHHEATLTDANQLYRICSSRPQRLTPTQGAKTERTTHLYNDFARRHIVKSFNTLYDSRRRQETAPFCLSVSRDYYVIALRHIIR